MAANVLKFPAPAPTQKPKKTKKAKGLMPDGRYRCMLELDPHPDGRRNRIPFYSYKSYADARRQADDYRAELQKGRDLAGAKQTVADWAVKWLQTYGSCAGDSANYSNDLYVRQLAASDLGKLAVEDVRDAHVQMYANSISGKSKSAVTKIRSVVGRVFAKAVANRMIQFDPTVAVRWTHSGEGTHRALDDWETSVIVKHWREHRAGLWAMFMLFAGLRRGEVLALRWSDIDFDAGVIHITRALHFKGNKARYGDPKSAASIRDLPILPPLHGALEGLYGPPRASDVCIGAKGGRVSQSIFDSSWDSLLNTMTNALNGEAQAFRPGRRSDKVAMPEKRFSIRPHDLRHTFCTMLFDAGVDLKTAQHLMGHDDAEMTMEIYTHLSKTRKAQSMDDLKKWCSKWCSAPTET